MKALILVLITFGFLISAQSSPKQLPVIVEVPVKPEKSTYVKIQKADKTKGYLLIETKEAAEKYFSAKDMKALAKVDFTKRKLAIFVWSGSGRDEIQPVVKESFPEQISFTKTRGRTRDLRQHFVVFSIRQNAVLN